jgi:hypothetical protein
MLRLLRVARATTMKARTQAIEALAALLVTAPGHNQNSKPRMIANNPYTSLVHRKWCRPAIHG